MRSSPIHVHFKMNAASYHWKYEEVKHSCDMQSASLKIKGGRTDCVCIIFVLLSVAVSLDGICEQTRQICSDEINLLLNYLIRSLCILTTRNYPAIGLVASSSHAHDLYKFCIQGGLRAVFITQLILTIEH